MRKSLTDAAKIALADSLLDWVGQYVSYDDEEKYYHLDLEQLEETCEACGAIAEALKDGFNANAGVKFYYD